VRRADLQELGLLVTFDRTVRNGDITAHSFKVLVMSPQLPGCWVELAPMVVGGVDVEFAPGTVCGDPRRRSDPLADPDAMVRGGWFRISPADVPPAGEEMRVLIDGDFIRDLEGKAVDADHLPPWDVATRVSGDGIAGGTFTSWFTAVN
jgi:hypothetical protein